MKKITIFIIILFLNYFTYRVYGAFEVQLNDARSSSLGGILISDKSGYEAGFQNPALLDEIERFVFIGSYGPIFLGIDNGSINTYSAGVAYKYKKYGTLGLFYTGLNVSSFNENIYNESSFKILYGRKILKNFSGGISFSLLKWSAQVSLFDSTENEKFSSSLIISCDVGIKFKVLNNLQMGALIKNINSPSINSVDKLPFITGIGLSYILDEKKEYMLSFNSLLKDDSIDYSTGVELNKLFKYFSLRSGIEFLDSGKGINFDIGMGYRYITLNYDIIVNYAFLYPVINLTETAGTHIISVEFRY